MKSEYLIITSKGITTAWKIAFILKLTIILSLSSRAQIFTDAALEGSSTLRSNLLQISGSYTVHGIIEKGDQTIVSNQFGIKAGIRITENFDLKLSFSRDAVSRSTDKAILFQIAPKISVTDQTIAFYFPVSILSITADKESINSGSDLFFIFSPRVILNIVQTDHFDLNVSPYLEVMKGNKSELYLTDGLCLGMGFTSNPDQWCLRTDIGIDLHSFIRAVVVPNLGLSLNVYLGNRK